MKLADVAALSDVEKIDLLYKTGSYIGKRKNSSVVIVLYQLDEVYLEVFYYKYRMSIYKIRCTDSLDVLDPYLKQVEIRNAISHLFRLNI